MSRVYVCRGCRKPFIKQNRWFKYCSTECRRTVDQRISLIKRVEREQLARTSGPGPSWGDYKDAAFENYLWGKVVRERPKPPRRPKAVKPPPVGSSKFIGPVAPIWEETEQGVLRQRWPVGKKPRRSQPRKNHSPLELAKQGVKWRQDWAKEKETIVAVLNKIKLDSGCVDCGYRGDPTALQFDHVRGVKIKAVSQFSNLEKALAEAAKCEIRCANCHTVKTNRWKRMKRQERIDRDLTILSQQGTAADVQARVVSPEYRTVGSEPSSPC